MLTVLVADKLPSIQAVFHYFYKELILNQIMKEKFSKTEVKKEIKDFFDNIKNKSSKDIKKIKKLAMKYSIKLGTLRKKSCRKCYFPYKNPKTRIRNKIKSVVCENCGYVSRWRIKD